MKTNPQDKQPGFSRRDRLILIAITLCVLPLTTIVAGVIPTKQEANPRQSGASLVYSFDVAATDKHGSGKLMINLHEQKFVFNGKDFQPDKTYLLYYRTASSVDPRVFASAVVTPSGNLHVEGTWDKDLAAPDATGFVVGGTMVIPGTIQRTAGAPCYTLTYWDASQEYPIYLPANTISYPTGGQALPSVIPEPVAVPYIKSFTSTTVSFVYQEVYYTANWYLSCPYEAPVITVTGSYSPYRVWNDDIKVYDWYWSLYSVTTYDASHLLPGVLLQRVSWSITGRLDDGRTTELVGQYMERFPGWPEFGIPPSELPLTDSHTINDGYAWLGCYSPTICPSNTWVEGPPFIASSTITTTDGNSFTTTIQLPQAK